MHILSYTRPIDQPTDRRTKNHQNNICIYIKVIGEYLFSLSLLLSLRNEYKCCESEPTSKKNFFLEKFMHRSFSLIRYTRFSGKLHVIEIPTRAAAATAMAADVCVLMFLLLRIKQSIGHSYRQSNIMDLCL